MSLVQPPVPDRRPSMELATNNPFRARLSGVPTSPASNPEQRFSYASSNGPPSGGHPQSRNPFLDVFGDDDAEPTGLSRPRSNQKASSFSSPGTQRPHLSGSAAELFENLTITDHSNSMSGTEVETRRAPPRPPQSRRTTNEGHHHSRSEDPKQLISVNSMPVGSDRPRGHSSSRGPPRRRDSRGEDSRDRRDRDRDRDRRDRDRGDKRDRYESSRDRPRPRPRRNSDSSVIDAHEADDRRDRDRRDRDRRHRDGKRSEKDKAADKRKKNAALDVIDKLDVTGIYGTGLFHHDGPFDACNPHRNKQGSRRLAPVQAFPEDSQNMAMSGFGPAQKANHDHVFGNRDPEAFSEYSTGDQQKKSRTKVEAFDPRGHDPVHGDESLGLGTSTFLDGAPAARTAVQRTTSDSFEDRPRSSEGNGGGLTRKKSLAQKIRGIKADGPRRRAPPPPGGGMRSPSESGPYSPNTPTSENQRNGDKNPFFNDYDDAYDKKSEQITVVKRDRAPSSPMKPHPGIERVNTDEGHSGSGGGLLQRVRSLSKPKGRGKRTE